MADRYPLIANSDTNRIEELASGDNLNLSGNSVSGITTITADKFIGDLEGTADSSKLLIDGSNILSGIISSQRLSGYYPIQVAYASSVDADGIVDGTIPSNVLSGDYNINITGTAQTANNLSDAGNILDGVIDSDRLTGVYDISITGTANSTLSLAPGTYPVDITGSAAFATTAGYSTVSGIALNVIGGIGSITDLDVSGITTLSTLGVTGLTTTKDLSVSGIVSAFGIDLLSDSGVSVIKSDVNLSLISPSIGVNTNSPNYNLDIRGDVSIDGRLYANSPAVTIASTTGTLFSESFIVGINTDNLQVGDFVVDSPQARIFDDTTIQSIGINSITISPNHIVVGNEIRNLVFTRPAGQSPGVSNQILVSGGSGSPAYWGDPTTLVSVGVAQTNANDTYNVLFTKQTSGPVELRVDSPDITYNPATNKLSVNGTVESNTFVGNLSGIASTALSLSDAAGIVTGIVSTSRLSGEYNINISGNAATATTSTNVSGGIATVTELNVSGVSTLGVVTATSIDVTNNVIASAFIGDGVALTGIVTQITAGIGVRLSSTQEQGKGVVTIDSYFPIGKTIFVTQNGNDANSGLTENNSKKTIKAAAAIAFPGDTIKVYPGVYIEENPVYLSRRVAVEGTELRNCVVTPKYTDRDLFYVNNGCHITDLSFLGNTMTGGSSIVSLQPLAGVATDRFFDAARMIRYNLDFIAAETVGYLTSTDYRDPPFVVVDAQGNPTDPVNCKDDIKDVMKAVIHDITRGGNLKCVGAGKSYYSEEGALQHIVGVKTETIDALNYAAGIARSCINNVSWTGNYQTQYSQVKDLSMQADVATGSNEDIGSCANVVSAIYSCVGIVTTILDQGLSILGTGINTSFPGNSGIGFTTIVGVTSAVYDNTSGETTILAPTLSVKPGDIVEVRDLLFDCTSGGTIGTQRYPSGAYGYQFDVESVNDDGSFIINTGVSTISHNYVGGGFVVNRAIGVTTASYDNTTGITTITAPGAVVKVGQFVRLHDLEFSCTSGAGTTTLYPTGNLGYEFRVTEVIGTGTTFVVNTGISTIPHTYEGGGVVFPPYSPGVGPITQGPYIRNCTNFVPGSIGMKVDGFEAEPGDQDDIGVTGTMSVDSYTQYNQGGIGVSITNGAYAQLVSIFTICDDIAIFTGSGGQCDITNSNSSFGTYGLVSDGVGDYSTKSVYHYTGIANTEAPAEQSIIEVSGIGNLRPYDGQALHFGELYYEIQSITLENGGFGYTQPPTVTIDSPTGPNGIRAEAIATINSFGQVASVDIISVGSQYRLSDNPQITISGPTGSGVTATASLNLYPIYYTIESATLPNAGISTVTLNTNLNNTVSVGTTVYFNRLSLQITSSHSFEWVGSGNDINFAKPALGGVVIQENEVVKLNGGEVVYTSTDQAGNFKIGDDLTINQLTGTITGRSFNQSILNTVTPLIVALGK